MIPINMTKKSLLHFKEKHHIKKEALIVNVIFFSFVIGALSFDYVMPKKPHKISSPSVSSQSKKTLNIEPLKRVKIKPKNKIYTVDEIKDKIKHYSNIYKIDNKLMLALAKTESGFDYKARNSSGAKGVFQLMPSTCDLYDVKNPYDPDENIRGGIRLMKNLLKQYDGNERVALAAYNAGSGAVAKHIGIPSYARGFVDRVQRYKKEEV